MGRQLLHGGQIFLARRRPVRLEQRRLQRRGGEDLQVAPPDLGIGILAGDRLALLGDADLPLHRAAGLGQDRLVARAAAAAHRSAPAVEQAQLDAVPAEDVDQADLRLVQLPAGGDEAAVLVAVRIAEHDLLHPAPALQQAPVCGQGKQLVHDARDICAGPRSSRTAGRCSGRARRRAAAAARPP